MKLLFRRMTNFGMIALLITSFLMTSGQMAIAANTKANTSFNSEKNNTPNNDNNRVLRGGSVKGCDPIDLGPDTVYFCKGAAISKMLTGPAGKVYQWNTGEATQSITVKDTGLYILETIEYGSGNLIANGDFSAGNTGFTTGYIFTPNIEFPGGGGRYDIVTNGLANKSWAEQFTDHTTGTGKYMFIDGNGIPGIKVWQQNITVTPNTEYVFYAWVRNLSPAGDINPELNFDINGSNIGGVYKVLANPNPAAKQWNQFYATWNSGSNTSITISIEDNVVTPRYNDFALDDISFSTLTCTATDSVVIAYKPGNPPTITVPTPAAVCKGDSVQLVASGAGVGGKYTWTPAATLSDPNSNNPIAKPFITTTYTVTGTDANDCSNLATVTVTLKTSPVADFYIKNPGICVNDDIVLKAEPNPAFTFTWSPTGTGTPNEIVVKQIAITQSYTLTVTDATGCSGTKTLSNTLISPNVSAGNAIAICAGGTATLNGTGNPGATFLWSPAASLNDATIANPIATPTTTTTYKLTGTLSGCTSTSNVTVSVITNDVIIDAHASSKNVCEGDSVTLFGTGASTFTWDNGVIDKKAFVPSGTQVYTVNSPVANGCTTPLPDTITVNVIPKPIVSAGAPQTRCEGDTVTLNGSGATTYTWDNGVMNNVTFTPLATKTYTVTGTTNGCSNTATVVVMVNTKTSVPIKANASKLAICPGDSVTLFGSGGTTYTWDKGVIDNVAFAPSSTQTYTVTSPTANQCALPSTDEVTVTVYSLPEVDAGNPIAVCPGDQVTLIGAGASTYVWDNGVLNNVSFVPTITKTYKVVGMDIHGCSASDTVKVTLFPSNSSDVKANASATSVCAGDLVTLFGQGGNSYAWNNGVTNNVAFSPLITKTYTVTVSDLNGCKKSDSILVAVCEYKIPSGFSPNNDLVHDNFEIFNPLKIPIDVLIYNRWGNLVYEKKNYDDNFDGNANSGLVIGEGLPDGTYFLVAEVKLLSGEVDKVVKYITLRR